MTNDKRRIPILTLIAMLLAMAHLAIASSIGSAPSPRAGQLQPSQILTTADAERILGQPARLTEEVSEVVGGVRKNRCVYTLAAKAAAGSQQTGVYFSFEQRDSNPSVEQARQVLEKIRAENEHDVAIVELPGVGDEAFMLDGLEDRYFILARKGSLILRLQVRGVTAKTSLAALKAFAAKAAEAVGREEVKR